MNIIRFSNHSNNNQYTEVVELLNKVSDLLAGQQQQIQKEIARLLTKTKPHVERIESNNKEHALKFNVFSALGVIRKEVIQSRFLAYLLDPNEHHCQGAIFLNAFLTKIGLAEINPHVPDTIKRVKVATEYSAGENLGRMDVVIFCKPDFLVVIENKVDAGEGDAQLARYAEWLTKQPGYKSKQLIFLTSTGYESETAKGVDYLRSSYLDLADAFAPLLNQIKAESVRIVLTQYITICKLIGEIDMANQDQQLLDLLKQPENIRVVLEIEQQSQLLRSQISKEFCENIQKILQSKLKSAGHEKLWKSSILFDQSAIGVEIKTLRDHATKRNYRMYGEHIFTYKGWGWSGWIRPQWLDVKNQLPSALDTKDLTDRMMNDGCNGAQGWWVCWKNLREGKKGFVPTDIEDIVACLEDNRTEDHPLANTIADELWSMFETYHKDIEALDSFKEAAL